jgi:6-pyruvoyltetrahydropterin/6-carboxytetrahydropterin synthase
MSGVSKSIVTVSKSFSFHAAHQLHNHDGQCARVHGHTYKLEVFVEGVVNKTQGEPDEGMVIDFSVIKHAYKELIEPLVEHQDLNQTLSQKFLLEDLPTTCENIALLIASLLEGALTAKVDGRQYYMKGVRLWETPTSFVEVGNV